MICFVTSCDREFTTMKKKIPIVGVALQKGGVGKTTSSVFMCQYSAIILNLRTALIDTDKQAGASGRHLEITKNPITDLKQPPLHPHYNPDNANGWNGRSSIADIFFGTPVLPYPTRYSNLHVFPADEARLATAENVKRQEMADKVYSQLHNFLSLEEVQDAYDVIVIDTPPDKHSPLLISALKAMTHLVIPLEMELQAIEGLAGILQLWKQESLSRPSDRPLNLVGILPNKVHSRRGSDKSLLNQLRNDPQVSGYVMPLEIVDRNSFPEADLANKSIFEFPKNDEARIEATSACKYIFERVFA
jgi:chromosome partitioning protein